MIIGLWHPGSGLGNQLHRYVMARILARDKGYDFGMIGSFKGKDFMKLSNSDVNLPYTVENPAGKIIVESDLPLWEEGTNYYNPEINFVEDNTIIDGEFQDDKYFSHWINDVRMWLGVEPLKMPDDLCVINFRGGEFTVFPDLFLTQNYWDKGIAIMKGINSDMRFEVHTDDPETAQKFFPDYKCIRDMALNWRSVRYAKYSIIANSSFPILPSLLNENSKLTIAPRYWARPNTGEWHMPQNYYRKFMYI